MSINRFKNINHLLCQFLLTFTLITSVSLGAYAQDEAAPAEAADAGADPALVSQGESLFKGNCTVCHAINEKVIGPALRNVHERQDEEWIKAFIKNSSKVIASGDEYAVNLYNEYNQTQMTSFAFSDEELNSLIAYIKAESAKPVEAAVATTATADGEAVAAGGGGVASEYITAILIGFVVVLVLILIVLGLIISVLTKYLNQSKELNEEDKDIVNQDFNLTHLAKSNAFLGFVTFFFLAIVLKSAIDGLFTVGVQQGYQPKQPIAFSHQLHAGQYEIECVYCHTGVEKAKSANIPSVNICMNCHSAIQNVGGQTGMSPEIQKIYDAAESGVPIEWVRVHNLPDLAYFNHSQHVKVGGLECQTCHGPIEEMQVVYQYSNLTMGWCINCHRETEVNAKGNEYYTKLVELHDETSKNPLKVQDIGGLECSKCHY